MANTERAALPPALLRQETAAAIARSRARRTQRMDDALSPEHLARVGAAVRRLLDRISPQQ
jgi:hypothetical protein